MISYDILNHHQIKSNQVEMSSVAAYSVGTTTSLTSSSSLKTNYSSSSPSKSPPLLLHITTCAAQPQPLVLVVQNERQLKRREAAIGIAFSFGLLHTFLQPQPPAAEAAEVVVPCEELTEAPSGLAFCDTKLGTGPQPVKGQLIKAHYVGRLENGKVFDSSYDRGKPLTFRVGVGEVIKGWDEGILGGDRVPPMLPGGKRTLKLPPQLGYGSRGAGCRGGSCVIPPDSVLLFDVEFVSKA